MDERDLDRQLVERAQRGDKHAFELLVSKYQRKLTRLLARFIRDPVEVEDVAQEAFIKAYRALPSFRGDSAFYTWLYRIGINTAKNYLVAMGRRAPTTTEFNSEDAEGFDRVCKRWHRQRTQQRDVVHGNDQSAIRKRVLAMNWMGFSSSVYSWYIASTLPSSSNVALG